MKNVVAFNSYKLQKGAPASDFLHAIEKMTHEFVSKQKGWISSMKFVDGETWADFIIFDSMDDMKAFAESVRQNELVKTSQSFMDFSTMKSYVFRLNEISNVVVRGIQKHLAELNLADVFGVVRILT